MTIAKPDNRRERAEEYSGKFGGIAVEQADGDWLVVGSITALGTPQTIRFHSSGLTRVDIPAGRRSKAPVAADNDNRPIDLWAEREHPSLPTGLLPPVIEEFARTRGEQMGVDPGGLAMAALTVCAAAIPDQITVKVKAHEEWTESARLWTALIGNPSRKKTPTINAAVKPLREIDDGYVREYLDAMAAYEALEREQRKAATKPVQRRVRIEDVTVEAAQEVLKNNVSGVLLLRDELSGWFGSLEKYGSAKGAQADRAFWLTAFNGGSAAFDRIGRGTIWVPNLSVCLLGGIQPEPMRKVAGDTADDGLLQRFIPIVLAPVGVGKDEPTAPVAAMYASLVRRLHAMHPPRNGLGTVAVCLSDGAQAIRRDLAEKHHAMAAGWEEVNRKLGSHLGKYDAIFARLCLLWHCIESTGDRPEREISEDTARRVADFLHGYLLRHALAFYTSTIGLSDRHDSLLATAGWILARGAQTISARDIRRGDRTMRELDQKEAEEVLSQLDAYGWLEPLPLERNQTSPRYSVRPFVHELFEERAEREAERREAIRDLIRDAVTTAA
jgi:hypothetical protein